LTLDAPPVADIKSIARLSRTRRPLRLPRQNAETEIGSGWVSLHWHRRTSDRNSNPVKCGQPSSFNGAAMKGKGRSAVAHKALRAIAIPAACFHGLLLSLGGAPQLQTTPEQVAQLRASLQTNPEDLAARERLINYYFDEATAPPRFRRTPQHDAEFTEQMLWIIRYHPESRALALMAPAIRAGFLSAPGVDSAVAASLDDALSQLPKSPELLFNASFFFRKSRAAHALELLQRARELDSTKNSDRYLYAIAEIYRTASIIDLYPQDRLFRPQNQNGIEVTPEEAGDLHREVERSSDPALLGEVGTLLARGTNGAHGTELLERAVTLEPLNPKWSVELRFAKNLAAAPRAAGIAPTQVSEVQIPPLLPSIVMPSSGDDKSVPPKYAVVVTLSVGPRQTPRLAVGEGYPSLVSKVDPEYTEQARRSGLSGTVLLRTVIDENGAPTQVAVIRGLGSGLDEKAIECVKQWRFHPAVTKDGRPIPVEVSLEVNFGFPKHLSQGSTQPIPPVPTQPSPPVSKPVPMPEIAGPEGSMSLTVVADYGQIYIYDSARLDSERRRQFFADRERNVFGDALQDALADGIKSRRFVGTSRGLIDLMTPGQYNFKTPMLVEVRQHEPGDDRQEWDHEVDLDLDIPSGVLLFEGSGGSGIKRIKVPPGLYRARVSGRGFVARGFAGASGNDSYRLRLWPRQEDTEPVLRKSWLGWAGYR
jgi:TonB family protein